MRRTGIPSSVPETPETAIAIGSASQKFISMPCSGELKIAMA